MIKIKKSEIFRSVALFATFSILFSVLFSNKVFAQENVSSEKSSQEKMSKYLTEGVSRYMCKDYKGAVDILSQAASEDPNCGAIFYYLAKASIELGNTSDLEAYLIKAVDLEPDNYWYGTILARFYEVKGDQKKAIQIYENLLSRFPNRTEIYTDLINLYLGIGDYDRALDALNNVEKERGAADEIVRVKFYILNRAGKRKEAIEYLQEYNKKYTSPFVLTELANCEMSLRRDSTALEYYNEALSIAPNYPIALFGKAEMYRERMEYDKYFEALKDVYSNEAVPVEVKNAYLKSMFLSENSTLSKNYISRIDTLFNLSFEAHPQDTSVMHVAEMYYAYKGEMDKVDDLCKEEISLYPDDPTRWYMYISFLTLMREGEKGIEVCDSAAARFPNAESHFFKISKNPFYFMLKKYDEIVENCEALIKEVDYEKTAMYLYEAIAEARVLQNEYKKAFKAYDKVLSLDPDNISVLNNYAYYISINKKYSNKRSLKKALAMSKKTIDKEPDNSTYLDTYAWILHLLGRDKDANPYFKRAMLYGGRESPVVLDHYAEVLYNLGDYVLAEVYWNLAISKNNGKIKGLEEKVKIKMEAVK